MRRSLAMSLLFSSVAFANDGSLDPSFGNHAGLSLTGLTDAAGNGAYGPVIQSDGKILICDTRTANGSSQRDFFVARFNADGTLDSTFSFDGKVTVDFDGGTGSDTCSAIALQTNGKIVIAGSTYGADGNTDFAIARLNTDGTLDTTFGNGTGKTTVGFDLGGSNTDSATGIAIQSNEKIVVIGTVETGSNGTDFGVVRLNTDGTRDNSFNLTGKVTFGFDLSGSMTKNDVATSMAIDSGGNILIAGSADRSTTSAIANDFAVARLLPNGQLDGNFDADGRATVSFDLGGASGSSDDQALGMTLQSDGNIVLVGAANTSTSTAANYDVAAARLFPDGSLDPNFGLGGKTLVTFDLVPNGAELAVGVKEQENGKLVLAGYALASLVPYVLHPIAVRLNVDGSPDEQFGSSGKAAFDLGLNNPSSALFNGVAFQGTQIIVSGGALVPGGTSTIDDFVARLEVDLIFANEFN